MKPNQKQQKETSLIKTSDFKNEFDIESISKDIEGLIGKYYQGQPMNMLIEGPQEEKGFFIMFIKKDSRNPENDLSVRTFGSNVTIGQLIQAFESVLGNIAKNVSTINIPRV